MTASWFAAVLAVLLPLSARADDADLKKDASQVVSDLLRHSELKGKRVAVAGFTDSEGRNTELSNLFAGDLGLALLDHAQIDEYTLIDRRNFGELAKEWELSVNGAVDDDNLVHTGRLLGADVLCIGRYTVVGKKLDVRATFVGAEKGEILSAASAEIKLDGELRDLNGKIVAEPKADPQDGPAAAEPLKVELWTDKTAYEIGEKMKINVKVNRDCYLTVIDVGTSDKATVIFPNIYAPSNAVKAGETYVIPEESAGFEFEVGGPPGLELVRAIASKEPSVDLDDAMKTPTAEAPFGGVKEELPALTRDIHIRAKKAKPGEWSESVLKLTVR